MFESFRASYNATERAVVKNLLMAVVSVLLSTVVLVLVFTLSGFPMMLAKGATDALVPDVANRINQPYLFSLPEKIVILVSSVVQLLVFLFVLLVGIAVPPVFMCCLFSLHYRNASE